MTTKAMSDKIEAIAESLPNSYSINAFDTRANVGLDNVNIKDKVVMFYTL